MPAKKTHEKFVKEVAEKFPWIKVIGFYVNNRTKIEIEDTRCGHIWKATPNNILHGYGCPKCRYDRVASKLRTPFEEFLIKLKETWGDLIEYIGGYDGSKKCCWFKCNVCGHVWKATPYCVLNRSGCPKCADRNNGLRHSILKEEFLMRLQKVWGTLIEYVEGYVNLSTKCKFRCTECNTLWEAIPYNILNGTGCPVCARKRGAEKRVILLDEFLKRLHEVWHGLIEYVSGYNGTNTKCWFKCSKCEHVWEAYPYNVLSGSSCPACIYSHLEQPIYDLLNSKLKLNEDFVFNKALKGCRMPNSRQDLRPDFLFLKVPLVFELDGQQHLIKLNVSQEEFENIQKRDAFKNKYFKNKEIILIRAVFDESIQYATDNYITLSKLIELINLGITDNGEINLDVFRPYDFNRE